MGTIFDHELNKEVPLTESRVSSKSLRQNKVINGLLRRINLILLWGMGSTPLNLLRRRKEII
jgi:hypothetical protein